MMSRTASARARLATFTLLLTALLLAKSGPTLVNAIPTPAGEGQVVKVANVRPVDSITPVVKFSAELPRRLPQCGPAWIKFRNSGNVRPLTLVLALQENLPIALLKANAKTTLDEVKALAPVQVIDNIRSLDEMVHPFQPHRRRGDIVEFFAFFPNGTGYKMNLKRVIQTGSASCLTPKCKKDQYLSADTNECASCPPNASTCDKSGRATKCSYGILTGGECIKKFCQRSTNIRGDECCTDGMAETCSDANTTLTCRKGWKLLKPSNDTVIVALDGFPNGTLVDIDRCQGPYAAHFGGSKQQFVTPKDAPWNWKIGNELSIEECAFVTLFPFLRNNDAVFLYEPNNGHFNCRAFYRQQIKLEFKESGGGRYDFGTGGTCEEVRASWPFAEEYFDRVGCEDILVRETRPWES